jgi:hypothetical protein
MRQDAGRPLPDDGAVAEVGAPPAWPLAGPPTGGRAAILIAVAAVLALALPGCAGDLARIPARGQIDGAAIETTVDAPVARYYLEHYLQGRRTEPEVDRALDRSLAELPQAPTRAAYQRLAERFSVDLATLHLIKVLTGSPANARAQALFETQLGRLRMLDEAGRRACVAAFPPTVLFVPGWFYRSQPGTGADFGRQRALLDRLGVENQLIPVVDNGTVEQNARIIAQDIRRFDAARRPVILVSVSKGGPEVAHALGAVLKPDETAAVEAWVNVGGLLKGAPLADWASVWPRSWLTRLYYWWRGQDPDDSIASLRSERSARRFAQETIPKHILVLNFVGIPLSGDISPGDEFGYRRTSVAGPNDGLAPIADEVAHGGATIVQVGLDHYFLDPEIDMKTLAMALTVMLELGRSAPAACQA